MVCALFGAVLKGVCSFVDFQVVLKTCLVLVEEKFPYPCSILCSLF